MSVLHNPTFIRFSQFILIIAVIALFHAVTPADVSAQTQAWSGVCVAKDTAGNQTDVATIQGFQCLVGNLLSIAISGIGFAGFIMMIVGSFQYLLSGGNAKGTEGGRNTLTFAVVGLVVALSSYMIIRLIAQFTGVEAILNFRIPSGDATNPTNF